MLKRMISYTDFDGNDRTELFLFNLTSAEMMELSVSHGGDLNAYIERIVKDSDSAAIVNLVKEIILTSYGEKSDDGKRFVKSDELREAFASSAAYSALFTDLFLDSGKQMDFIKSIMPPDWENVRKRLEKEGKKNPANGSGVPPYNAMNHNSGSAT